MPSKIQTESIIFVFSQDSYASFHSILFIFPHFASFFLCFLPLFKLFVFFFQQNAEDTHLLNEPTNRRFFVSCTVFMCARTICAVFRNISMWNSCLTELLRCFGYSFKSAFTCTFRLILYNVLNINSLNQSLLLTHILVCFFFSLFINSRFSFCFVCIKFDFCFCFSSRQTCAINFQQYLALDRVKFKQLRRFLGDFCISSFIHFFMFSF